LAFNPDDPSLQRAGADGAALVLVYLSVPQRPRHCNFRAAHAPAAARAISRHVAADPTTALLQ
jgi:hypothetical protein